MAIADQVIHHDLREDHGFTASGGELQVIRKGTRGKIAVEINDLAGSWSEGWRSEIFDR